MYALYSSRQDASISAIYKHVIFSEAGPLGILEVPVGDEYLMYALYSCRQDASISAFFKRAIFSEAGPFCIL